MISFRRVSAKSSDQPDSKKSSLIDDTEANATEANDSFQSAIQATQVAPSGWKALYLASVDKQTDEAQIVVRPIILWVTVETTRSNNLLATTEIYQEIRHFIVDADGDICDFEEFEYPFLCVVEPGEDVDEAAGKAIAHQIESRGDVC